MKRNNMVRPTDSDHLIVTFLFIPLRWDCVSCDGICKHGMIKELRALDLATSEKFLQHC